MARHRRGRGFTLLELVVVMALLTTIVAIAAPVLSHFVRGRGLVEESRRFLALTRYGRSEAASRGVPMVLWLDPEAGAYGLEAAPGFATENDRSLEYQLADGLRFELDSPTLDEQGRASIAFGPDGAIDEESLAEVAIRQDLADAAGDDEAPGVWIARADVGMSYEIRDTAQEQ